MHYTLQVLLWEIMTLASNSACHLGNACRLSSLHLIMTRDRCLRARCAFVRQFGLSLSPAPRLLSPPPPLSFWLTCVDAWRYRHVCNLCADDVITLQAETPYTEITDGGSGIIKSVILLHTGPSTTITTYLDIRSLKDADGLCGGVYNVDDAITFLCNADVRSM